jgi:hypothetical protein
MTYITKRAEFKLGREGEHIIMNKLLSLGEYEFVSWNDTNTHDFILSKGDTQRSYEIKTDTYKAPKNFFFEFFSWGKASGVAVTKADWFCYFFINEKIAYFIKSEDLKLLLKSKEWEVKKIKFGEEGNLGHILPISEVEHHFKKYTID